jgi:hypothetical protein
MDSKEPISASSADRLTGDALVAIFSFLRPRTLIRAVGIQRLILVH